MINYNLIIIIKYERECQDCEQNEWQGYDCVQRAEENEARRSADGDIYRIARTALQGCLYWTILRDPKHKRQQ